MPEGTAHSFVSQRMKCTLCAMAPGDAAWPDQPPQPRFPGISQCACCSSCLESALQEISAGPLPTPTWVQLPHPIPGAQAAFVFS